VDHWAAGVEDGRPPAGPPPVAAVLLLVFLYRMTVLMPRCRSQARLPAEEYA
jgi:hypothetical protein